jgi:hypothetical protein
MQVGIGIGAGAGFQIGFSAWPNCEKRDVLYNKDDLRNAWRLDQ